MNLLKDVAQNMSQFDEALYSAAAFVRKFELGLDSNFAGVCWKSRAADRQTNSMNRVKLGKSKFRFHCTLLHSGIISDLQSGLGR